MKTRIIEASNGFNWGKFMLGRFDSEWERRPQIDGEASQMPLLRRCGWDNDHLMVVDLQTGEGAIFRPGGSAAADLNGKHKIWVCPLFEPFLAWLYRQPLADLDALPDVVQLDDAESAMHGYRRKGMG